MARRRNITCLRCCYLFFILPLQCFKSLFKCIERVFNILVLKCLGIYHFWGTPSPSFLGFKSLDFKDQQQLIELKPADPNQTFPTNIEGTFFRVNPGKFDINTSAFLHFFDGIAMLHGFYFDQGKVMYQSKFLEAEYVTEGVAAGELTSILFNTTPFSAVPNTNNYGKYFCTYLSRRIKYFFHMLSLFCCKFCCKKKKTQVHKRNQDIKCKKQVKKMLNKCNITHSEVNEKYPHLVDKYTHIMNTPDDHPDEEDPKVKNSVWFYDYALQTNVAIVYAGEKLLTTTDGSFQTQFNGTTLETIHPIPFQWNDNIQENVGDMNKDSMDVMTCSHASWDPKQNYYYNFFLRFRPNINDAIFSYVFFKWNDPTRTVYGTCDADDGPRYTHCTAMTERYFLLPLTPYFVNLTPLLLSQPVRQAFEWHENAQVVVYVIDKCSGERVAKFYCGTFFFFHIVSAYEFQQSGKTSIVIDFSAYPNETVLSGLELENVRYHGAETVVKTSTGSHTIRAIFDLSSKDPHSTLILKNDPFIEFPKINDVFFGSPFKTSYGVGLQNIGKTSFFDCVYKLIYDPMDPSKPPTYLSWSSDGCYCTEPIFLPFKNCTAEEDGVVVSIILDTKRKLSFLLVLNAKDFTEICRYYTPTHIPFGNHGMYTSTNYISIIQQNQQAEIRIDINIKL